MSHVLLFFPVFFFFLFQAGSVREAEGGDTPTGSNQANGDERPSSNLDYT